MAAIQGLSRCVFQSVSLHRWLVICRRNPIFLVEVLRHTAPPAPRRGMEGSPGCVSRRGFSLFPRASTHQAFGVMRLVSLKLK
jgi:hypothetical protein